MCTCSTARGLPEMNDVFWHTQWEGGVKVATYPSKDFTGTPRRASTAHHRRLQARMVGTRGQDSAQHSLHRCVQGRQGRQVSAACRGCRRTIITRLPWMASRSRAGAGRRAASRSRHRSISPPDRRSTSSPTICPASPGNRFGLGIVYEPDLISAEAKTVCRRWRMWWLSAVGFNPATEGEGHDRTFALPWGQDALIEAVAAANPHTIVTLTGGGGMDASRWLDKVPALLHLCYPGQEGGTAVADVLFGKHDPEGKLPVSFDRSWEDNPSYQVVLPDPGADTTLHVTGADGQPVDYIIPHVKYGDKLMVGYRYWTTTGKHPLFPFGFGLSYTTFSFSNLEAPSTARFGLDGHRQLRRDQYRQRRRRGGGAALCLRPIGKGRPTGA